MVLSNNTKIFWIKFVHTVIYVVMVAGIFEILYSSITKSYNIWLYISLVLLALEVIVYFGNGKVCPFTDLAKKYGDPKGYVGDVFMPKRIADNTFNVFGFILATGLVVWIANLLGLR
jgi:hypothetical protein